MGNQKDNSNQFQTRFSRFIDYVPDINNGGKFEKACHGICLPELDLKRDSRSNTQASFLGYDIKNVNWKFSLTLYHKRDFFPLSIIGISSPRSNMPSNIFCTSRGAGILKIAAVLRIAGTTTELEKFKSSCAKIVFRMIQEGGTESRIKPSL